MTGWKAWIIALIVPALMVALFFWAAPPRHNPFAPVDLAQPVGLGTWHHLTRAKKNPELCFAALDDADVLYTPIDDSPVGQKCGLYNAVTLDQSLTPYSSTIRMTCAQTAALYMWERHIARPGAIALLGSPIARIETYGTFSCRNVAGTTRPSEHASANAIDIAAVRLEDGRLISVKEFWGKGGREGAFLEHVHRGGCKLFSVSLGPDYNAAHADHFHFDMGKGNVCR
jgi:hypothetical protein